MLFSWVGNSACLLIGVALTSLLSQSFSSLMDNASKTLGGELVFRMEVRLDVVTVDVVVHAFIYGDESQVTAMLWPSVSSGCI